MSTTRAPGHPAPGDQPPDNQTRGSAAQGDPPPDEPARADPARADPALAGLHLADWRRRVAELYGEVRRLAAADPARAWEAWRAERQALYRGHASSPVPASQRAAFRAAHWPYDPRYRFEVRLDEPPEAARPTSELGRGFPGFAALQIPASSGAPPPMHRIGVVEIRLAAAVVRLTVLWVDEYSGGLFLPFGDATNGHETYGAGRYLLDTAKGADLGGDPATGMVIVDLNFAYHPSCAFDPRWSCPLAPPENRVGSPIQAGERLA